jgi:hypothetical protein
MLSAPQLPLSVRQKVYEYVKEKIAGLYGHKRKQIRRFTVSLVIIMQVDVRRAFREVELFHRDVGPSSFQDDKRYRCRAPSLAGIENDQASPSALRGAALVRADEDERQDRPLAAHWPSGDWRRRRRVAK